MGGGVPGRYLAESVVVRLASFGSWYASYPESHRKETGKGEREWRERTRLNRGSPPIYRVRRREHFQNMFYL